MSTRERDARQRGRELTISATTSTLEYFNEDLGMTWAAISDSIDASGKTVKRWRRRKHVPSPEHQRRVEKMSELRHLLREIFGDPEHQQEWLHSSVPRFNGRRPISLLREGKIDEVIGLLAALESGAHL